MPKAYIPSQKGTSSPDFSIGAVGGNGVTLDTSAIAGAYTLILPPTAGTSGYALVTDGAGVLSWVAVGSAADSSMPYFIPIGDTYTVNVNKQGLYALDIDVDGSLIIEGILAEVD